MTTTMKCPLYKKCGGCQYQHLPYEEQLKKKQAEVESRMGKFCRVAPIVGMENPLYYRNKVHAVFDRDKKGNVISGVYEEKTHKVVPVEKCLIEDQTADAIIGTIRGMCKSFKIKTYDEDTGYGLLRHVLVRKGFATGQVMVVLVTADSIFPSKKNFVAALRRAHPEITTVVQNINPRSTSMVLGDREQILCGKGYIEDVLCGCTFRISSKSFYQVNPVQTEKLYGKAIELAGLTGKETILDAYCGIGTIGLIAAGKAKEVIGVELNKDAVKDAIINCKRNEIKNARFFEGDAGKFMVAQAGAGKKFDVVMMDPPRSGSCEEFLRALVQVGPKRIVYVSCNPETLEQDVKYLVKKGYEAMGCYPVDMFAMTAHIETVCLLSRKAQ